MTVGTLLLSVEDAYVAFGRKVLFEGLTFHIQEGSKIALVGKNGTGKSTLMKMITGALEPDEGERFVLQGTTIGYLAQTAKFKKGQSIFDYVFEGLTSEEKELESYKVDMILTPLELEPEANMDALSGGQLRRAAIARALVEEPDILLLDEPTNHLDLHIIEWLEEYLKYYPGTFLCISHDKAFLKAVTNKVFWLDRGKLKVAPKGFEYFEEWSSQLLEEEARALKNREKILAEELEWASRGVKARRKRNQRRLQLVREERDRLKADKSSYNRMMAKIEVPPIESALNSKVVAEFHKVYKGFGDIKILEKFSMRLMKGDRIGVLGKNGAGKTTFLKLLLGQKEPDQGNIKRSHAVEFAYFDQKREALDQTKTIKQVLCPDGGDYIDVRGKPRHVCGYMKEFMFDPDQVNEPVRILSGGQQNRLLLAKTLANPKDCLILDEPTNDLDMETLEMLEEIISQYKGTLLIVSHDRDFLDQTVSKILAFEGNAEVDGCIGGYSDYIEMKSEKEKQQKKTVAKTPDKEEKQKPEDKTVDDTNLKNDKKVTKLSFKEKYALENLPKEIEEVKASIKTLETYLADPESYKNDPEGFVKRTKKHAYLKTQLDEKELLWLELMEKEEQIAQQK